MKWFVVCACVAVLASPFAPRAAAQPENGRRSAGVVAHADVAAGTGTGAAVVEFDRDADPDVLVTAPAGVPAGKGVAVGDLDDDGWPDLFVTRIVVVGRLYRDNRDGTFTDITRPRPAGDAVIETIKIEGGKVEITGQSIKVEGGKVEIIRRRP
jgi:hypothetical protein